MIEWFMHLSEAWQVSIIGFIILLFVYAAIAKLFDKWNGF